MKNNDVGARSQVVNAQDERLQALHHSCITVMHLRQQRFRLCGVRTLSCNIHSAYSC